LGSRIGEGELGRMRIKKKPGLFAPAI